MRILSPASGGGLSIDSFDLLGVCEFMAERCENTPPAGSGTRGDPYLIRNQKNFAWAWKNADSERYYNIDGRLIRKMTNHYVSDVGAAPGVTTSVVFELNNPTYKTIAERFEQPSLILNDQPMNGVDHSRAFSSAQVAESMTRVMKGEAPSAGDPAQAAFLPVVMAAMFIAEPARNKRAWPINLMILRLMHNRIWPYSWSSIFWHPGDRADLPEICDYGISAPRGGSPIGKKKPDDRSTLLPITRKEDLFYYGGHLPSSPAWGGILGKKPLINSLKETAVTAKMNPQAKFDFIHQKEIDVLLQWLLTVPTVRPLWNVPLVQAPISLDAPQFNIMKTNDVMAPKATMPNVKAIHTAIADLVSGRS